jgi:hypothetical protein
MLVVMPAKAGIQSGIEKNWIPACAGMTTYEVGWAKRSVPTTTTRTLKNIFSTTEVLVYEFISYQTYY